MNSNLMMTNGAAVRESCRQLVESWLSRDIRRIMLFAEPLDCKPDSSPHRSVQTEKGNKKTLF